MLWVGKKMRFAGVKIGEMDKHQRVTAVNDGFAFIKAQLAFVDVPVSIIVSRMLNDGDIIEKQRRQAHPHLVGGEAQVVVFVTELQYPFFSPAQDIFGVFGIPETGKAHVIKPCAQDVELGGCFIIFNRLCEMRREDQVIVF